MIRFCLPATKVLSHEHYVNKENKNCSLSSVSALSHMLLGTQVYHDAVDFENPRFDSPLSGFFFFLDQ